MVLHQPPVSQEGMAMGRPPPRPQASHPACHVSCQPARSSMNAPHVPQLSWPQRGQEAFYTPGLVRQMLRLWNPPPPPCPHSFKALEFFSSLGCFLALLLTVGKRLSLFLWALPAYSVLNHLRIQY